MKVAITLTALLVTYVTAANPEDFTKAETIYDFEAEDISGNVVKLDKYKGHPLLIVNVASNCGLTERNYKQLNELFEKYNEKGLRILAFPSNQFKEQEPGTNAEIAEFAKKHDVKFDMFAKIDVNGDNAHPLYKFLKYKQPSASEKDGSIEWNFAKFIVDKNGMVVERFAPMKDPADLASVVDKYL